MATILINATEKALILQEKDKIILIFFHAIISIVCDRPYCRIVTNDGKSKLIQCNLKTFLDYLPNHIRLIDKSTIFNLSYITSIRPYVAQAGSQTFKIARRKYKEVLDAYKNRLDLMTKEDYCLSCRYASTTVEHKETDR